jgi:hypothetical protein
MPVILWAVALLAVLAVGLLYQAIRSRHMDIWLRAWLRQDWRAPAPEGAVKHLMFCFVDHYEPAWLRPSYEVERQRVLRWKQDYPKLCARHKDADGRSPVHTFFYPEEEYRPEHLDDLVDLCRDGLGEIEIHLHHDHDTEAGLREKLRRFTKTLVDAHDALPVDARTGQPLWAFIHGNWALDNAQHPDGTGCGVNNELIILREEGCYADYTLPAAPNVCQTTTINQIYYAKDDPDKPKSHDTGVPVRVGGVASGDLMIIQGPLGLDFSNRKFGLIPRTESSDIRTICPPSAKRADMWVETGIHVKGRPEWIFVKIHTHGTQERDMDTLLGKPMDDTFSHLEKRYNCGKAWKLHYVSAREMYNIIKAAEAGREGDPNAFRDFVIPRPGYARRAGNIDHPA